MTPEEIAQTIRSHIENATGDYANDLHPDDYPADLRRALKRDKVSKQRRTEYIADWAFNDPDFWCDVGGDRMYDEARRVDQSDEFWNRCVDALAAQSANDRVRKAVLKMKRDVAPAVG